MPFVKISATVYRCKQIKSNLLAVFILLLSIPFNIIISILSKSQKSLNHHWCTPPINYPPFMFFLSHNNNIIKDSIFLNFLNMAFIDFNCSFGGIFIGFIVGVFVGWVWKPSWVYLANFSNLYSNLLNSSIVNSVQLRNDDTCVLGKEEEDSVCSASKLNKMEDVAVTDEDLDHLYHLVERKDGGPPWKHMMDRSTHDMSYQAWQRDIENGRPQYCSRTVYEDATPELLRDFFWDDEFRLKWDDMLIHANVLEECPSTGTMVVQWIRKFPFFCSDREYIIGRRIWESGRSYYAVTKGVPNLSVPRKDKPRRVDLFYSSWLIRAVESRKGDGELLACEVILFHYEDMGIPWEIAKFGVRQGMWGAVRNIERGFRAYQKFRASGPPISHHALMAQINTKAHLDYLKEPKADEDSTEFNSPSSTVEKPNGGQIPKLLIIGGAVAVACSLNRGLLTKTLIFGIARRFGNIG